MKNSIKALAKEAKYRMRVSGTPEDRSTLPDVAREQERVFNIICRLQSSGEVVTNPIMQVADPTIWKTVRGIARERYVLNLSAVYNAQLDRYRKQNN
jgi:hypothetical protein